MFQAFYHIWDGDQMINSFYFDFMCESVLRYTCFHIFSYLYIWSGRTCSGQISPLIIAVIAKVATASMTGKYDRPEHVHPYCIRKYVQNQIPPTCVIKLQKTIQPMAASPSADQCICLNRYIVQFTQKKYVIWSWQIVLSDQSIPEYFIKLLKNKITAADFSACNSTSICMRKYCEIV